MDKNDDGKISKEEFLAAVLKVGDEHKMIKCEEEKKKPVKRVTIPPAPQIQELTGDNALIFKSGL